MIIEKEIIKQKIIEVGYRKTLEFIDRKILLAFYDQNLSERKNAIALNLDRNSLRRKLRRYNINSVPY